MKIKGSDLLKLSKIKVLNENRIRAIRARDVSIDSRKCKKSEIFIAIKGERFDGHDFIADVLKKGTTGVIAEKRWFKKLSEKQKSSFKNKAIVLADDSVKTLGELARNHRRKFLIPVIAIAGSNGKTTAKDFIAHVLSEGYTVLKTEGNMNNAIGVPLTLLRLEPDHSLIIVELGTNHFGEIDYLCRISEPQLGVITNIGKEHLEFFRNLNGVAKAECELMDYLANYYGTYFLNTDDTYLVRKMKGMEMSFVSYGTKSNADIKGKIKKFKGFNPEIEIKCGKQKINTKLNTIGSQSFNAALCAAAFGYYFDIPSAKIKKALSSFNSLTAKRNQLKNVNGTWFIDDTYNSNPDSAGAALKNLKLYKTSGNKHVVLSDMLELGKSSKKEHTEIGRLVKKMGFKYLYTYGKESLNTFRGAKGVSFSFHFNDKNSLVEMLKLTVKKNDIVLVKGSRSMKMEDVINQLSEK